MGYVLPGKWDGRTSSGEDQKVCSGKRPVEALNTKLQGLQVMQSHLQRIIFVETYYSTNECYLLRYCYELMSQVHL